MHKKIGKSEKNNELRGFLRPRFLTGRLFSVCACSAGAGAGGFARALLFWSVVSSVCASKLHLRLAHSDGPGLGCSFSLELLVCEEMNVFGERSVSLQKTFVLFFGCRSSLSEIVPACCLSPSTPLPGQKPNSAVMFVYCLLRLWKAGVSVLWAAPPPFPFPAPGGSDGSGQGAGGVGGDGDGDGDGGVVGGEGVGEDPATRLVRFALSRHLLVDVDAEGWSEVCVCVCERTYFVCVHDVFYACIYWYGVYVFVYIYVCVNV